MPAAATSHDRAVFESALAAATDNLGLKPQPAQVALMWDHLQRVLEANRHVNLTRITAPADAAVRHYADSLSLLTLPGMEPTQPRTVLDVGTGAGFPAVPLAIVCPAWRIAAIDGTSKKVRFLAEAVAALGLTRVEVLHARAADLARQRPGRFDLVLLRAVATLAPALGEVHHLARPGGRIVFYKTARMPADELAAGRREAARLRFNLLDPVDVDLPAGDEVLHRRFVIAERPRR